MRISVATLIACLAFVPAFGGACPADLNDLTAGNWCSLPNGLSTFVETTLPNDDSATEPYFFDPDSDYSSGVLDCRSVCTGRTVFDCTDDGDCPEGESCYNPQDIDYTGILGTWSGGAFDTTRQELLVSGGGHNDGCDNGVYGYSLEKQQWRLVADASEFAVRYAIADPSISTYTDDTPSSAHTYDTLTYMPSLDAFCINGIGSGYLSDGNSCDHRIYCTDVKSLNYNIKRGWYHAGNRLWQPSATLSDVTGYDRRYGRLYTFGMQGSPGKAQCTYRGSEVDVHYWDGFDAAEENGSWAADPTDQAGAGVVNPKLRYFYKVGGGQFDNASSNMWYWDLNDNPPTLTFLNPDITLPEARHGPGIAWDQHNERVVAYLNGNATGGGARNRLNPPLYVLDDTGSPESTWSWTACSMSGGETLQGPQNGDYGRFQYSHKYNGFVVVDGTGAAFFGKLPISAGCGTSVNANDIRPERLAAEIPGHTSIAVRLPFGGDDDDDATVNVRYRTSAGPGAWSTSWGMHHTDEETTLWASGDPIDEGWPIPNEYTAIIPNLAPDTKYDIEVSISDPDGYSETQQISVKTRAAPVTTPASPNYPCPDDGDGDGPEDVCDTLAEIRAAISAATPGSIINIPAGTYTASLGDGEVLDISNLQGTSTNPIFIQCADRFTTILDADSDGPGGNDGERHVIYGTGTVEYVHIEDCQLTGNPDFFWGGGETTGITIQGYSTGVVIRDNYITSTGQCINLGGSQGAIPGGPGWQISSRAWIVNNFCNGPNAFGASGNGACTHIETAGTGNIIRNNTITRAGDAIFFPNPANADDAWPPDQIPYRGNEISLNDINIYRDDCAEMDSTQGNNLVWQNRCSNGGNCFSFQPVYGAGNVLARNICWNQTNQSSLKTATAGGDGSYGPIAYNNIFYLNQQHNQGCTIWEVDLRNNLWMGPVDPAERPVGFPHVMDGNTRWCTGSKFTDNPGDCHNTCTEKAISNYNAYNYDSFFRLIDNFQWDDLADLKTTAPYDANSIIVAPGDASDIFADSSITIQNQRLARSYQRPIDARLNPTAGVIDQGVQLGAYTDGFTGASPDIGPFESSGAFAALPQYGASWVTECNNYIDDDGDGSIDLADENCNLLTDTSEGGLAGGTVSGGTVKGGQVR